MRKTCLEMVYQMALADERIIFIGSDLGEGTLAEFRKKRPKQFFMEGICEAGIIGMAAGMALEGKIVYVNTIASFLTRRVYEQIAIDLCHHNVPVRLIGNGGGLVYAPLGPTHTTIEDLAIMRSLPNMTIVAPADAGEMKRMMPKTVDLPGPLYIRLAKGYDPIVTPAKEPFEIGKPFLYGTGKDALIVSTGVMLQVTRETSEHLKRQGIDVSLLHVPTIKPFNAPDFRQLAQSFSVVITVEEHSISGGLGSIIAECLAEGTKHIPFKRLGLPDSFPDHYGSQAELWGHYGLTPEQVAGSVTNLLGVK